MTFCCHLEIGGSVAIKKKPSAAEDERQLSVQQTREGFLLKSASSLTAVSQRFIEVPCVSSEHQHE